MQTANLDLLASMFTFVQENLLPLAGIATTRTSVHVHFCSGAIFLLGITLCATRVRISPCLLVTLAELHEKMSVVITYLGWVDNCGLSICHYVSASRVAAQVKWMCFDCCHQLKCAISTAFAKVEVSLEYSRREHLVSRQKGKKKRKSRSRMNRRTKSNKTINR